MKLEETIDAKALGKVAVLLGGHSAERAVSLMSGQGVLEALRAAGVDAQAFDPAERPLQALQDEGFERVFIALHGRGGEDGAVQGALEWLGIPYTGSGVMASALCMDKTATKRILVAEGLSTPQWLALARPELTRERVRRIPDELGLPVIVKPPHEGSSIGISKAAGYSDMNEAVELALRYDDELLFEQCIEGPELTCAVLGEGEAALALRHLQQQVTLPAADVEALLPRLQAPQPRVSLGLALAPYSRCAIDISDGLVADLGHICAASACAAPGRTPARCW